MGYWGHIPPAVPRDGPLATKSKRAAAAVAAVGIGADKVVKKKPKKSESQLENTRKRQKEACDSDDGGEANRSSHPKGTNLREHSDSDAISDGEAVGERVGAKAGGGGEGVKLGKKQGREQKAQKVSQCLHYGRFLAIPISVEDEPERLYLGKIIDENIETNQFLIFFKEDGDRMWYDKDEVCFDFDSKWLLLFSSGCPQVPF